MPPAAVTLHYLDSTLLGAEQEVARLHQRSREPAACCFTHLSERWLVPFTRVLREQVEEALLGVAQQRHLRAVKLGAASPRRCRR